MKRVKGCMNTDCSIWQTKTKLAEALERCPECSGPLEYVCQKKNRYQTLSDHTKKHCVICSAKDEALGARIWGVAKK